LPIRSLKSTMLQMPSPRQGSWGFCHDLLCAITRCQALPSAIQRVEWLCNLIVCVHIQSNNFVRVLTFCLIQTNHPIDIGEVIKKAGWWKVILADLPIVIIF
jgi:hypothetical protein